MKTSFFVPRRAAFVSLIAFLALAPLGHAQQSEAVTPQATAPVIPGILPAFITAGLSDPAGRVPALNAVAGAAVANLSIATPTTLLIHGQHYTYTVAMQDNNYTGAYSITYSLTQLVGTTTKTLQTGTIVSKKTTTPGGYWVWASNALVAPTSPGLATLTGTITYGTNVQKVSTQVLLK